MGAWRRGQRQERWLWTAMLREQLPGVEVWAYGSRINGRGHGGSDLDLVLRGPDLQRLPSGKLSDLAEAFRESNIPFLN